MKVLNQILNIIFMDEKLIYISIVSLVSYLLTICNINLYSNLSRIVNNSLYGSFILYIAIMVFGFYVNKLIHIKFSLVNLKNKNFLSLFIVNIFLLSIFNMCYNNYENCINIQNAVLLINNIFAVVMLFIGFIVGIELCFIVFDLETIEKLKEYNISSLHSIIYLTIYYIVSLYLINNFQNNFMYGYFSIAIICSIFILIIGLIKYESLRKKIK